MTDGAQYPQPHEGVKGADLKEGHLLALDGASIERRLELRNRMREYLGDVLHGAVADRNVAFDRMYNPVVGDMVMELTTSFRADLETKTQGFGILLVHERKEWACTDEEWTETVAQEEAEHKEAGLGFNAEQFARNRFADTASYIQYGPAAGDVCRWRNCKLLAVPADFLRG